MPSIKLFRRSTKAPTETSAIRSIGTKLKESKLAKKASALSQTLHAKQTQFKASLDKNCHQIGNFVASKIKIKYNKSRKMNFDSPLESNGNATPSLAPLGANKPEKVNFGERLEKAIDRKVNDLEGTMRDEWRDVVKKKGEFFGRYILESREELYNGDGVSYGAYFYIYGHQGAVAKRYLPIEKQDLSAVIAEASAFLVEYTHFIQSTQDTSIVSPMV